MQVDLIAQSHLDPVFMWPWQEGLAETIATCRAAVKLLKKYPELVFVRSDALAYRWIARSDQNLLQEIKELVRQNRWIPIAGCYTQADSAVTTGESRIRQSLIGQAIFREYFGIESQVAYLPDSWGHPATLPKLLAHCGYRYFTFSRPDHRRLELPSPLFNWIADDNSSILSYRIPIRYSTYADEVERIKKAVELTPSWLNNTACFFGVGNHGGGPTEEQIKRVREFIDKTDDLEIRFSHPQQFFETVADSPDIPDYRGGMENFAVGCFSSAASFKQLYDRTSCRLLSAEKFSSMASAMGVHDYDTASFNRLWEDLLFCEFHDILPGTSIKEGMEDAAHILGGIMAGAARLHTFALRAILNQIDTSAPAYVRFAVFNNTSMADTFYFEYEPWLLWQKWKDYSLIDENGNEVPCQQTQCTPASNGHTRLIIKLDLPANSCRFLRVIGPEPDLGKIGPENAERFRLTARNAKDFSTDRFNVGINHNGDITRIRHRQYGIDLANAQFPQLQVFEDSSDTWSLHLKGYQDSKLLGTFETCSSCLIEAGPLRWSIESQQQFGQSTLRREVRLYDQSDLIELHYWLDWHEQWSLLKLNIALPFKPAQVTNGLPFGKTQREPGVEEFGVHSWLLATTDSTTTSADHALAILTGPGIHGADYVDNTLRITLLRSPLYCHEQIACTYEPGFRHEYMDQGQHHFVIGLLPASNDIPPADLVAISQRLGEPVSCVTTHAHPGNLKLTDDILRIEPNNIALSAVKRSQNNNTYIIRLWETAGRNTGTTLFWLGQELQFDIAANQICSLELTLVDKTWKFNKVDGLEKPFPIDPRE